MNLLVVGFLSLAIVIAAGPVPGYAEQKHPEKWYKEKWCREHGGTMEVVLPDQSRADCVTETHALAFDFAPEWAKAVGHSLYYAMQTGKKPGVVLIMEDEKQDLRYWLRLNTTILHHKLPIETWEVWE